MDAYYSAEQELQKELLSGETLLWAGLIVLDLAWGRKVNAALHRPYFGHQQKRAL